MSAPWQYASSIGGRARTRRRAALAASILLHLLGATGLLLIPHGSVSSLSPVSDIAIDLVPSDRAAPDNEPIARARDSQPALMPRRDHRRGRQHAAPGDDGSTSGGRSIAALPRDKVADSDAARASAELTPPVHRAATEDAPSQEIHERVIGSARDTGPSAPAGVNLSFEGLAAGAKLRALPSARGDPLLYPRTVGAHRQSPMEELTESERNNDAEENVRRGRAHPSLFEYLRGARTRLEPEATRLAEALPLGPSLSVQGWGRGYLGRLAEVGKNTAGRESFDSTIHEPINGRRTDLFPAYNEAGRQAAAGAEQRTAEICLGVAPDRPIVVTLRRSSGHAALDQLARDSFQKVALARPVAADIRPGLACYLVRISAFRMPPLPTLSFGIKNGKPDVTYPLKRLTKVTVELMSVDHGDDKKPRSLLHAR